MTTHARGVHGYLEQLNFIKKFGTIKKPKINQSNILAPTGYWSSMTPDEWAQWDTYTKSIITLNVKNPLGFRIRSTQTAAKAWRALTVTYI
jgi:hypothetical protein